MSSNTIISKTANTRIPVGIQTRTYGKTCLFDKMTAYDIYDGNKQVGYIYLLDKDYGCHVQKIENTIPNEYKGFGYFADKLEVQYCLEKGINDFEIRSLADFNSHALHYLRGKRFEGEATPEQIKDFRKMFKWARIKDFNYDTIVRYIIDHTPKGEKFNTKFLGQVPMYMPKELIKKYAAELLKNPIIIK